MSSSRLVCGKGKEPVQPTKRSRQAGGSSTQSTFKSTHFPAKHLVKRFHNNFMTCEVLTSFFVLPDWLRTLNISNRNLFQLLEDVGWINALLNEENVYPD